MLDEMVCDARRDEKCKKILETYEKALQYFLSATIFFRIWGYPERWTEYAVGRNARGRVTEDLWLWLTTPCGN
jgi:hypothetical protein